MDETEPAKPTLEETLKEIVSPRPQRHLQWLPRARQCCGNCDAYVDEGGTNNEWCRAKAPIPFLVMVQNLNPLAALDPKAAAVVPAVQGYWPPTRRTKWCREWQPKLQGSA